MRILIANTPRMYREALALVISRHDPDHEVLLASPGSLDGEAERFGPHALVRDDDGVELEAPEGVVCWIGIAIEDSLRARISVDGRVSELRDVSVEELLAALDDAEKLPALVEDGR